MCRRPRSRRPCSRDKDCSHGANIPSCPGTSSIQTHGSFNEAGTGARTRRGTRSRTRRPDGCGGAGSWTAVRRRCAEPVGAAVRTGVRAPRARRASIHHPRSGAGRCGSPGRCRPRHDRWPAAPAADVVAKSSLRDQVKVGADGGHCPVAGAGAVPGVQGGLGVEAACLGEALAPAGEAAVPGRSSRISLPASLLQG